MQPAVKNTIGHGARTPTILYVDCRPDVGIGEMRLAGMRRCAATRKWRVETLERKKCSPAALREALAKFRPIGCAVECGTKKMLLPDAFDRVPVVYFSPPEGPEWRDVPRVECDEAAVARMAFRELSSGKPSAYAVVAFRKESRWQRERIDAFRECCREAGFDCPVALLPDNSAPRETVPTPSLVEWAASLPSHCAVFAVNDNCARIVADALMRAGRSFPRTVTLCGADGAEPHMPQDRDIAPLVSSVVLDHEMSGYLAAKALGEHFSRGGAEPLVFPPLLVDRRKSTRGYGRREPHILEAMEMIRREACDGLTVSNLARRFLGLRRLFEVRFREAAGHSALDEILNVRLARAVELLAHTDKPVAAVADFCGFETKWEFWHVFRKRLGVSPQAFRDARR